MKTLICNIKRLIVYKKGQSMIEYGFIISFIALAVIVALGFLGGQLASFFEVVNSWFS
ncbi:MAG: Flp family type IVb pilin [Clostridia bacterium]|nr:Flp family type IVb pilin [Clostridia bacterium]